MKIGMLKGCARSVSFAGLAVALGALTSCSLIHKEDNLHGGVKTLCRWKAGAEDIASLIKKDDIKARKAYTNARLAVAGVAGAIHVSAKTEAPWLCTRIDITEKAIDPATTAAVQKFMEFDPYKDNKSDGNQERDELIDAALKALISAMVNVAKEMRMSQADELGKVLNSKCEWATWDSIDHKAK